jgi:hypothetical protein
MIDLGTIIICDVVLELGLDSMEFSVHGISGTPTIIDWFSLEENFVQFSLDLDITLMGYKSRKDGGY